MQKSTLKLEATHIANQYRSIFKTRHGRTVFLSVELIGEECVILDCFYIDRNQGYSGAVRYSSRPKKQKSFRFPVEALLSVIAAELDKQFYGVHFITTERFDLSVDDYIRTWFAAKQKYRFLILVGEGELDHGLPVRLRTRLKNKLHRSILIELEYYKDGKGVVKRCCYYDRVYKREGVQITPPMLLSCFFPYTKEGILNLLNHELYCDFTHILITDGIDLDSNTTPLCGAL